MRLFVLAATLLASSTIALAAPMPPAAPAAPAAATEAPILEFKIKGTNPDGKGAYEGTAHVQKSGDGVLIAEQTINGVQAIGYGVSSEDGKHVAIYMENDKKNGAVLILTLQDDGNAKGYWTTGGAPTFGSEEWTFVKK